MDDSELNALLQRLRDGDRTALDLLWRELSAPLYTFLLRLGRSRELAEDCLQEFFVRLCTAPPEPPLRRPRAYLYRTAHNLAVDTLRKERPGVPLDTAAERPARGADIAARLDLERALAALPPEDRLLVTLHLNGGLRFREAAEALGLPLGTVLWRYRRALDALREHLKGENI